MYFLASKKYFIFCKFISILIWPIAIYFLFFQRFNYKFTSKGIVDSKSKYTIRSKVNNTFIKKIHKYNNDKVSEGELLIELFDNEGIQNKIRIQSKKVQLLESEYLSYKDNPQIITKFELKKLQFNYQEQKIILEDLNNKLSNLFLYSPSSGYIMRLHVEEQEKIEIGTELATIATNGTNYVMCKIPEKYYMQLGIGDNVFLKSEVYNYLKYTIYTGKIQKISYFGLNEKLNALYEVEIALLNNNLRIGTTAKCEFIITQETLINIIFRRYK